MKSKRKILLAATVVIMAAIFFEMRELASWRPQLMLKAPGYYLLAVSPQENWILLARENAGAMRVWNRRSGETRDLPLTSPQIPLFADENHILLPVFESEKRLIEILNLGTGKTERVLSGGEIPENSPLGDWNISGNGAEVRVLTAKSLRIWNWRTGILTRKMAFKKPLFQNFMQISPDGRTFFALNPDSSPPSSLWDSHTGKLLPSIKATEYLHLTANPRVIYDETDSKRIYLHLPNGEKLWEWQVPINYDAYKDDGFSVKTSDGFLAFAPTPKGLELRDLETGKLVQIRPEITPNETSLVFLRDGNFLWTSNPKGEIRRFRIR